MQGSVFYHFSVLLLMAQTWEAQQIITTVVQCFCCQHDNPGVLTAATYSTPLSFASPW